MKIQAGQKSTDQVIGVVERKNQPARGGTKTIVHRYERRKIREHLRHLDWALAIED